MIITRTPLRISLGGGGTDLPSYYEQHGGFVLAGSIDKYIFVSLNHTFSDDYFLKYSVFEHAARTEDIEHPIVREAFLAHGVQPAIEMASMADIPAGTGLGSSGSFAVGLLNAISAFQHEHPNPVTLAEEACAIEIETLGRAVGKQDQYIAAFGGITCFDFHPDGTVGVSPLQVSTETIADLEDHLLMFFTGYSRDAESVLGEQKKRSEDGDRSMIENLDVIKQIGHRSKEALEQGRTDDFGRLMHEHWLHKRQRSEGMSNPQIDAWYELGLANGVLGGKLVGAGAGGFLLFYAEDPSRLRSAFRGSGLREVRFNFEFDGSVVLARG